MSNKLENLGNINQNIECFGGGVHKALTNDSLDHLEYIKLNFLR